MRWGTRLWLWALLWRARQRTTTILMPVGGSIEAINAV